MNKGNFLGISARLFQRLFSLAILVATLILVYIFLEIKHTSKALQTTSNNQAKSFLLADELRQSSDDLTSLTRTYIETLNPSHKERYMDILAIREGQKPRAKSYHRTSWALNQKSKSHSYIGNIQKSLIKLMEETGFTQEELKKIKEAKRYSDKLTHIELKAMNMANGLFMDKNGKYTITGKADTKRARNLVHSKEYHKYKREIMEPIDDFFELMDKRIKLSLANDEKKMGYLQQFFIFVLLADTIFIGLFFALNYQFNEPSKKLSSPSKL